MHEKIDGEEEEKGDMENEDADVDMESDEDQEVLDQPWGFMVTSQEVNEETEDVILPNHPRFLPELHSQKETTEYCLYCMAKNKKLWFMNIEIWQKSKRLTSTTIYNKMEPSKDQGNTPLPLSIH